MAMTPRGGGPADRSHLAASFSPDMLRYDPAARRVAPIVLRPVCRSTGLDPGGGMHLSSSTPGMRKIVGPPRPDLGVVPRVARAVYFDEKSE